MSMDALRALLPKLPQYAWDWDAIARSPVGPLLAKLDGTPQHPAFHGEGDAGAHTRMVCRALADDPAYRAMDEGARDLLAASALLHDNGKIPTTKMMDGRWTSPNHGAIGSRMARELLWTELGMSGTPRAMAFREGVCLLVRRHMLPVHVMEREDSQRLLIQIAQDGGMCGVTVEMLCALAAADVRGRIAADTDRLMENVQLCSAYAEECGCRHGAAEFADSHTRRAYFKGRNVQPAYGVYDDTWGEVVLMSGLPGTGKDTWIGRNLPGMPVVSLDELRGEMGVDPTDEQGRVAQAAKERAREYLRAKRPFVWNATNLTQATRASLIGLFESYGASVRIVYLETEWTENLRRNANRRDAVPEAAIGRMLGKLEPPHSWEARRVDWICV